nr:MFS transporter [Paraburkholderia fungorum]
MYACEQCSLLVSGQLSDHYGCRPVLLTGLLAALISCGLFAGANSIDMLAVGRLLAGVSEGGIVSGGMAAAVDAGGPERKPKAALSASIAMVLSTGLGPLCAGGAAQWLAPPVLLIFAVEAHPVQCARPGVAFA